MDGVPPGFLYLIYILSRQKKQLGLNRFPLISYTFLFWLLVGKKWTSLIAIEILPCEVVYETLWFFHLSGTFSSKFLELYKKYFFPKSVWSFVVLIEKKKISSKSANEKVSENSYKIILEKSPRKAYINIYII